MVFSIFTELYSHHQINFSKFLSPQKKLCTHQQSLPIIPQSPKPWYPFIFACKTLITHVSTFAHSLNLFLIWECLHVSYIIKGSFVGYRQKGCGEGLGWKSSRSEWRKGHQPRLRRFWQKRLGRALGQEHDEEASKEAGAREPGRPRGGVRVLCCLSTRLVRGAASGWGLTGKAL